MRMLERILRHANPLNDHAIFRAYRERPNPHPLEGLAHVAKPVVRGIAYGAAVGAIVGALTGSDIEASARHGAMIGELVDLVQYAGIQVIALSVLDEITYANRES